MSQSKTNTSTGGKRRLPRDAEALCELLVWARDEGIAIEALTVGSVGVTLRPAPGQVVPRAGARETLYERMGGPALGKLVGEAEDGPYEPAIKG